MIQSAPSTGRFARFLFPHQRLPLRCALAVLLLTAGTAGAADPAAGRLPIDGVTGPSAWLHDYGLGRRLSKELGLPLIVHFHASWCGPCQQMERETLTSRQLVSQLGRQVIGVKIDSDAEPGLVEAFRVDALPCDIVVAPDGLIVNRNSGYQPKSDYLAMVTRVSDRFRPERQAAIARLQPTTPSPSAAPEGEPEPPAGSRKPGRSLVNRDPVQPRPPVTPDRTTRPGPPQETRPATPPATATADSNNSTVPPLIGLDGYCPVHIKTRREWVPGKPEYSTTWQGVIYRFASAEDLRTFQTSPQRYAPRMLGCDPVELWTRERAVQGSVEYGAFFNGDLFLFVSAQSRNQFKVNPGRYVQLRHAFRADDVIGTRLR